jgi:hypothetical protein
MPQCHFSLARFARQGTNQPKGVIETHRGGIWRMAADSHGSRHGDGLRVVLAHTPALRLKCRQLPPLSQGHGVKHRLGLVDRLLVFAFGC